MCFCICFFSFVVLLLECLCVFLFEIPHCVLQILFEFSIKEQDTKVLIRNILTCPEVVD